MSLKSFLVMCLGYEKMGVAFFKNFNLWEGFLVLVFFWGGCGFLFYFIFKYIVIPIKNKNNTAALWLSLENKNLKS